MLNITMDTEVTFDLPCGVYPATLTNVKPFYKQAAKGKQDWIRLIFGVTVPGMENLDCRAGRNFLLSFKAGSDLRNFLTPTLGHEFFLKNSAKTIDLEKLLIGKNGQVELSHFIGEQYEKPLVVVERFNPVNLGGKD